MPDRQPGSGAEPTPRPIGSASPTQPSAPREAARFDLLMAEMSDAVIVRDELGAILWGSRSVFRVFGYRVDEMLGTSLVDLIHPDDQARVVSQMAADSEVPGAHPPVQLRARHADGHWIDIEAVATNLLHDELVGGVVINVRDVTDRVQAGRALLREQDLTQALLDTASCLVISVTPDGRVVSLNRAAEELSGYTSAEVVGRSVELFIPEAERAGVSDTVRELNAGDFPNHHENHWITKGGECRLISWTNTAVLDDGGRPYLLIGTGVDVTDERRLAEERLAAELRFRVAFDHGPGAMALLDADGAVLEANARMATLLAAPDGAQGVDALERLGAPARARATGELVWEQRAQGRRRGDERTFRHRVTTLAASAGGTAALLLDSEDITAQVRDRNLLEWEASHDALTGLSNRGGLVGRLADLLPVSEPSSGLAVLLIDLDGFKAVNDRLGHQAGDAVLTSVAGHLMSAARTTDLVVRLGGDEFVIVADDISERAACALGARIERAVAEPIKVGGELARIGASIGVSMAGPTDTPETLIAAADLAMYDAKEQRRRRAAGDAPHVGAPLPENEEHRLAVLRRLDLLDTEPDETVEAITRIAAEICGTPIAAVSLIDEARQWMLSQVGIEGDETRRDEAFCAHTILGSGVFSVDDAALDDRFRSNPLVVGDPNIRFYAGAPLEVEPGVSIGALCVIDREPRHLSVGQSTALADLARLLTDHLLRGVYAPAT